MSKPARNLTVNVRLDPLDGLNSLQSRKLSHDARVASASGEVPSAVPGEFHCAASGEAGL